MTELKERFVAPRWREFLNGPETVIPVARLRGLELVSLGDYHGERLSPLPICWQPGSIFEVRNIAGSQTYRAMILVMIMTDYGTETIYFVDEIAGQVVKRSYFLDTHTNVASKRSIVGRLELGNGFWGALADGLSRQVGGSITCLTSRIVLI